MALSGGTTAGAARAARDLQQQWYEQHLSSGMTETQARAKAADRSQRALESARGAGINDSSAIAALTMMAQNKSRSIGTGNFDIVQKGIEDVSHGNVQLAQDLAFNYQFNSRQAQRLDLGGDWTSQAVKEARTPEDKQRAVFYDAVSRVDTRSLVSGHPDTVKQAASIIKRDFASADPTRRLDAATLLSELHGNYASATGASRDVITSLMVDPSINIDMSKPNIDEQLVNRINVDSTGRKIADVSLGELQNHTRTWGSAQQRTYTDEHQEP
jgi:hypothetical protein